MASSLIQIQWWLKQPKVWRFIGFAYAVVGLLCYALSSSFNYLFGEWNLLKAVLYSVFSFIICVAVLYAKAWQPSAGLCLKAHIAVLVLTITSFYSFFFDNAVNGKPNAYSLISCASFAVMSLSLSRQTHCGIEVDLLYFFLGALIVQLSKIKWLLGMVGVGFSYCLIILRSYLDALPESNEYIGFQDQPHVVIQVGSQQLQPHANSARAIVITDSQSQQTNASSTSSALANAHDQTISKIDSHPQEANTDFALFQRQLLASIKVLKKKNRNLVRTLSNHIDMFKPDPNLLIDTLLPEIINNLNDSMKLAMEAGFEKECCHMYSSWRREFLRQCLNAFGVADFDREDGIDNVVETAERIEGWIRAFEITSRLLFPNERRLCDHVFSGFSSARDLSFMLVCKELTLHLLNFANGFTDENDSLKIFPDRVKVFKTLHDMIPELESLFQDQYGVSLRNEANKVMKGLGEAIGGTFLDLENLMCCDSGIADVPGGIYPISYEVVNCLSGVIRESHTIEKVFKEYPMVANRVGMSPSLFVEITRITEQLESHLKAKSKNYMELGLCFVSMMNNIMFIQTQLAEYRLLQIIIGEDWNHWIQTYTAKVRQNLEDYQNSSWSDVLGLLKQNKGDESVAPDVAVAESMKEKLDLFNIQFEEICSIQLTWFAHYNIRRKIIMSLENMLLPAYGNFIGRFQGVLGKCAYEYIRFGIFDIKDRLNRLFMNKQWKEQKSQLRVSQIEAPTLKLKLG